MNKRNRFWRSVCWIAPVGTIVFQSCSTITDIVFASLDLAFGIADLAS